MKIRRTSDCESIVSLTNNDIRFQVKSGAGGESISTVASHKRIYGKDTISKNPKSISLKSEIASRMNRVNYVKKLCIGAITRLKLKVVSRVGERGWGIISFSCSKIAEMTRIASIAGADSRWTRKQRVGKPPSDLPGILSAKCASCKLDFVKISRCVCHRQRAEFSRGQTKDRFARPTTPGTSEKWIRLEIRTTCGLPLEFRLATRFPSRLRTFLFVQQCLRNSIEPLARYNFAFEQNTVETKDPWRVFFFMLLPLTLF